MMLDALSLHFTTLDAIAGEPIAYSRGVDVVRMRGVLGKRRETETDRSAPAITAKHIDWLIKPAEFSKQGLQAPKAGDRIIAESGRTFEVKAEANVPCWEWSDPRQTFYRIHTIEQKKQC